MNSPYLHQYPDSWPKPDPSKPETLPSRITEDDKVALYNRRITTRALAAQYNVSEKWLSNLFPGKRPLERKTEKRLARAEFRRMHAQRAVKGEVSIQDAAVAACCSYSTMRRIVLKELGQDRLGA